MGRGTAPDDPSRPPPGADRRGPVTGTPEGELIRLTSEWDRAMVSNDADAIGAFMADEWVIIGPDGRIGNRADFLAFVRSGALTHDVMESEELDVRVYGDAALVIARGTSGGTFEGTPFLLLERVSSLFVRSAGRWRCVSTHLSPLTAGRAEE